MVPLGLPGFPGPQPLWLGGWHSAASPVTGDLWGPLTA